MRFLVFSNCLPHVVELVMVLDDDPLTNTSDGIGGGEGVRAFSARSPGGALTQGVIPKTSRGGGGNGVGAGGWHICVCESEGLALQLSGILDPIDTVPGLEL